MSLTVDIEAPLDQLLGRVAAREDELVALTRDLIRFPTMARPARPMAVRGIWVSGCGGAGSRSPMWRAEARHLRLSAHLTSSPCC